MTKRPCVILESPYAGNIKLNLRYARTCVRHSIMRGEAPIASHLLYTQDGILNDDDMVERMLGISCGLAWLPKSDYSVFYTDKGWSSGMLAALHDFNLKGNHPFRIRALHDKVQLPATLDEDLEALLRTCIEE